MSTNVKNRVLLGHVAGPAAAVIALAIAIGIAAEISRGDESTATHSDGVGLDVSYMREDPENYPAELQRLLLMIERENAGTTPDGNIGPTQLEARIAHELFEEEGSRAPSAPSTDVNPLEGVAE